MKKSHHQLMTFLALVLSLASVGCKDAFDRLDCVAICDSYKECKAPGTDVDACTDACYSSVEGNEVLEEDASDCTACMSEKTCSVIDESCHTCDKIYGFIAPPAGMGGMGGAK